MGPKPEDVVIQYTNVSQEITFLEFAILKFVETAILFIGNCLFTSIRKDATASHTGETFEAE